MDFIFSVYGLIVQLCIRWCKF